MVSEKKIDEYFQKADRDNKIKKAISNGFEAWQKSEERFNSHYKILHYDNIKSNLVGVVIDVKDDYVEVEDSKNLAILPMRWCMTLKGFDDRLLVDVLIQLTCRKDASVGFATSLLDKIVQSLKEIK